MRRVIQVAEQLTIEGTVEYFVYYDDDSLQIFKDYPTEAQLSL